MTAAQRRTATVTIGGDGHQVSITADVSDPAQLTQLAEATYNNTRPPGRTAVGFASQLSHTTHDRQPAGSPWHQPTTAKEDVP